MPTSAYRFVVRVNRDPGRPLAQAKVLFEDKLIGTSGEDGAVRFVIDGAEGEVFALAIRCPEGYRAPPSPLQVTLRRLAASGEEPEYAVTCSPGVRTVVVAVRADHGPNLPVVRLGQEVARTDASGAAHVLLQASPGEGLELSIDTRDKANERLRPQNPTLKHLVQNRDEILLFEQPFVVERAPAAVVRVSRPTPLRSH